MNTCLMFHGLGPPPAGISKQDARYWLPAERFSQIIGLVRGPATTITIDDANESDITIALPALREAGLSATFFVPSDRIDQPGYLSANDIRTLRASGMRIGSHGCAHIVWTEVSNEVVADDVMRSIERLSSIVGERIREVAVPFGECDLRVLRVLRRLGVGPVYTSFRGPHRDGAWIVRRHCITSDLPDGSIGELLTTDSTPLDAAMGFLRVLRHAGPAALWSV